LGAVIVLSVYRVGVLSSPWLWMMRTTVEVSIRGRVPAGVATVVVVVLINVAEHLLPGGLWLGPVVVIAFVCFARWSGLSWSQLGLGGDQLWSVLDGRWARSLS
jgi:hypothetical protein